MWANSTQDELGDSYNAVYNDAVVTQNSIQWTAGILDDINNFFETEPAPITTSTAAPVVPPVTTTVTPSPWAQPVTPQLPEIPESGAATYCISVALLAMAGVVNFLV